MLAGLLFAIEAAVDEPSRLLATLPFAGATLIEHQARQLIAAGAGQIIVVAEAGRPDLIGAVHRIARRGVSIDIVAGATDAAGTLHPLARVVMLADGLVTTDALVRMLSEEDREALIVVPADGAPPTYERVGGAGAWAGAARLDACRLRELAELPADYDPQSTLLRLVEAAGAARLPLPSGGRDAHGIERSAAPLALVERRIVAATLEVRPDWYHRILVVPLVRLAMPPLVARGIETGAVVAVAAAIAIAGLATIGAGSARIGLVMVVLAMLIGSIGSGMAALRNAQGTVRGLRAGRRVFAGAAVMTLAWRCAAGGGTTAAWPIAVALIVAAALVERSGAAPARWWGGPASCLLVVAAAALVGWPAAGLALAASYAVAMLAAAIEALRRGLAPL